MLVVKKKSLPLQPQIRNDGKIKGIGVWCNGNTADSGPAFPGSSPGTPTSCIADGHEAVGDFFCFQSAGPSLLMEWEGSLLNAEKQNVSENGVLLTNCKANSRFK